MRPSLPEPCIELGDHVVRRGREADAAAVAAYFTENREHLATYSPVRVEAFYTSEYWLRALAAQELSFHEGREVHTFLVHQPSCRVLGEVNLSNIVRGAFQACHLGYSIAAELQGRGLMRRAVEAVVSYAFEALHLHRVMASYVPSNQRSARLLASLSFVREGFAPHYLLIAGRWQDHVLTARLAPDWTPLP